MNMDRNQLIAENVKLANHLGRRWKGLAIDEDEREAEARLGLVIAGRKYDPSRNDCFGAFVTLKVGSHLENVRRKIQAGKRFCRRLSDEQRDNVIAGLHSREPSPADRADLHSQIDRLNGAMGTLPPKWREAIRLYYGLDSRGPLPCPEIARILGCSPQWANRMVLRGIKRLKRLSERDLA